MPQEHSLARKARGGSADSLAAVRVSGRGDGDAVIDDLRAVVVEALLHDATVLPVLVGELVETVALAVTAGELEQPVDHRLVAVHRDGEGSILVHGDAAEEGALALAIRGLAHDGRIEVVLHRHVVGVELVERVEDAVGFDVANELLDLVSRGHDVVSVGRWVGFQSNSDQGTYFVPDRCANFRVSIRMQWAGWRCGPPRAERWRRGSRRAWR